MENQDHGVPPTPPRRLIGVALAAGLLVLVLLSVLLVTREDEVGVNEPHLSPTSVGTSTTSVRRTSRTEIVERLKVILKVRDEAFHNRAAGMLNDIYTADCPCLEGDRNAIKELTSNNYRVVGGTTSIRVQKVDKVTERLWLVIADFRSAPLRIESESGELIRKEPAGSDLFQFALSKPSGSTEWLLGQATAYKDGSG